MDLRTRPLKAYFAMLSLFLIGASPVAAQGADVSRNQIPMVSIQIGEVADVHVIPLTAYQALVQQGVPTRLISGPARRALPADLPVFLAQPAPSSRGPTGPLMTSGWKVGVFR